MLFIHGDADTFVPFEMLDEVYNAAKVEKEKLIVPGAGHGEAEGRFKHILGIPYGSSWGIYSSIIRFIYTIIRRRYF